MPDLPIDKKISLIQTSDRAAIAVRFPFDLSKSLVMLHFL